MNVARRGPTVLIGAVVGAVAIATAVSTSAAATPAAPTTIVHACNQHIAAHHYACQALRRADLGFVSPSRVAASPAATPSGYGPSSLQSAYKLPSSTAGSGQRIYVVDAYNDPNAESDLAAYRTQYGLPACTTANGCFKKLNQTGATSPLPAGNTGWAGEISLDLDMVSAVCPNCGITLIEATDASDNLFTAVKEATTLGAKFVSMSWGGADASSDATYDSQYFQATGVVYTASTGDSAYQAGTIYPATSNRVVAVGGTALNTASNTRGWTESVWKTNTTEGTGSGCSAYEAKPSFQSSAVTTATCSKRADSDVSAVADPATGVAVYQTYGGSGWAVYGGTSAAAPIIASVYALAGTPAAGTNPAAVPYSHTGNLFDVTSGNNGTCSPSLLCTAAAGWDGPTGLGTPNGVAAFGGTTSGNTVTVTNPGSKTGTVGTATSLQISATDSGGAALTYSASGLPTGLSINVSSGLISGTPSAAGTFSVTASASDSTGASGSASFTWTISGTGGGSCTGQKLLNPGFESGTASWTSSSGVINTDGAHAHAGSGYSWLDGYGSAHTDSISQSVTIPAGCAASLTYYLYISSSEGTGTAYDKLSVTANGTQVQAFSNVNKGSGYVQRTVSLSGYAGQTVTIKWTGTEDASVATSFFVDDTALTLS